MHAATPSWGAAGAAVTRAPPADRLPPRLLTDPLPPPIAAPTHPPCLQVGDALPDVKVDQLVGGEVKSISLKELFAGK